MSKDQLRVVLNAKNLYWYCLNSILSGDDVLEVALIRRENVKDGEPQFNSASFAVFEEDVLEEQKVLGDDLVDKS